MSAKNAVAAVTAPLTLGGYSIYKDMKEQKRRAQDEINRQRADAERQQEEIAGRTKQDEIRRRAVGALAQNSLRAAWSRSSTNNGTIFSQGAGQKTLLGM